MLDQKSSADAASKMPGIFFPPEKRTPPWVKIVIVAIFLIVAIVFFVPPSSWLIPDKPMFPGSPGMIFSPIPDYDPRWRWLAFRGWIAVPALKDALKDGTPYARRTSAETLGKRHDVELISDLEQSLTLDSDMYVRYAAAYAIAEIGGPEASKSLRRVAVRKSKESEQAIYALGKLRDNESADFLFAIINEHVTENLLEWKLPAERALREHFSSSSKFSQEVVTRFQSGSLSIKGLEFLLHTMPTEGMFIERDAQYSGLIPELETRYKTSKDADERLMIGGIIRRIQSKD